MKKLTNEEFIKKSKEINGDKFDYTKTNYITNKVKVIITCKIHGDFEILPTNHIHQKQGCVECARDNHKLTYISEERLNKFKETHDNFYTYEDLSVNNGIIKITCPFHGEFEQIIYHHERGHGCPHCSHNIKLTELSEERLNKLKELHNYYYTYEDLSVRDGYINIICPKHGNFTQDIYSHENGGICKTCYIEKRNYKKEQHRNSPLYKIKQHTRRMIRNALIEKGYTKKSHTYEILGCSYEEFKIHIENQFTEGLSWDHREKWHIDHIVPLSFAENEEETLMLNHYTNLRPLLAKDNLDKGSKILIKNDIYFKIMEKRNS